MANLCRLLFVVLSFYFVFAKEIRKESNVPYVEKYFDQTLDHFNFVSHGDKTFKQRYLMTDTWWDQGKGPIFFYTGNEGPITAFWDATGFMFDIAPQFGALIVFAEHVDYLNDLEPGKIPRLLENIQRYYGKSLPFGNDTFQPQNMGLLTVEQAMADYAVLIDFLKTSLGAKNCPVIAFGGSYGGMLSAFMRFKYPNLITGSIAASAPIYLLTPDLDRTFFFNAVTKDFESATPNCKSRIQQAFVELQNTAKQGASGLAKLSTTFKLCKPLKDNNDVYHLEGWIRNSMSNLAMFDYPYPAKLFNPLPANPVTVACGYMEDAIFLLEGLRKAAGLFYTGTSTNVTCYDIFSEFVDCADQTGCGVGSDSQAWDFQACTEINLVSGSNNVTDMFPVMPFTQKIRQDYCYKTWKVVPRDSWGLLEFWGKNIKTASNIVFSNGDLDPWRGGGVLKSPNANIMAFTIEGGAHHLDLRAMNPDDPITVKEAREMEKQAIRRWINV